ncbi:MAG: DUF202 domain-containing protein [Pirellulales bacterium]
MSAQHDPRVYFSAERTLLAWIRTALAVIGVGFAVARIGLTGIPGQAVDPVLHWRSHWIGGLLIAAGTAMLLLASWQHVVFTRGLDEIEKPPAGRSAFTVGLALLVAVLSAAMAVVIF